MTEENKVIKLLFATGGDDCVCGGDGIIVFRDCEGKLLRREPCPCVKAFEATVERCGGIISHGSPDIPVRQGTVVPKGVGVGKNTILGDDSYTEEDRKRHQKT